MSEANAAVESVLSEEQSGGNSQNYKKYTHFTPQHRAKIAKYASEYSCVRHFSKEFSFLWRKVHVTLLCFANNF